MSNVTESTTGPFGASCGQSIPLDTVEFLTDTDQSKMVRTPAGETLTFYIGDQYNDGEWHYMEFDLPTRMQQFGEAPEFEVVNALMGYGLDLDVNVDDLVFGGGLLGKSYQIIPGAAIGGYIGAQTGMEGSHYDDFYTSATATIPAYGKYYYNYNDLGTVTSTVDDTGAVIGVYVPDFFGNYRYVDGDRPDRLGLQTKFEDPVAGLNYVHARWYDREWGRWVSKEPFGLDGPNLYHFCLNNPAFAADLNGLWSVTVSFGYGLYGSFTLGKDSTSGEWFAEANGGFGAGGTFSYDWEDTGPEHELEIRATAKVDIELLVWNPDLLELSSGGGFNITPGDAEFIEDIIFLDNLTTLSPSFGASLGASATLDVRCRF